MDAQRKRQTAGSQPARRAGPPPAPYNPGRMTDNAEEIEALRAAKAI